jgi:hypothetical protein
VSVALSLDAAEAFEDFTAQNIGRSIALLVDGMVQSAPVVRYRVEGGHISIASLSLKEAKDLAQRLRDRAGCKGGALLNAADELDGTACSAGRRNTTAPGGVGGSDGAPPKGCPTGLPGPSLVGVPVPQGGMYCMDATEVTNREYKQFVTAKGTDTTGQDPWCDWNMSYVPSEGWPAAGKDDFPVVYIDWCDASAYCRWAGKHLCGKIGGGTYRSGRYADPKQSEWFSACSRGGSLKYPYGCDYDASTCVGFDYDGTAGLQSTDVVRPVGSARQCQGGYPGLFDLSGNVLEWEDSCRGNAGANDGCRVRGGSFGGKARSLQCSYDMFANRDFRLQHVGFRCCASLP